MRTAFQREGRILTKTQTSRSKENVDFRYGSEQTRVLLQTWV